MLFLRAELRQSLDSEALGTDAQNRRADSPNVPNLYFVSACAHGPPTAGLPGAAAHRRCFLHALRAAAGTGRLVSLFSF